MIRTLYNYNMCVIHLMPIYVFAGHKSWTCCSPHGRVSQSQLPLIRLQQGNAKSWKRTTSRPRKRDLPRHPKCRFYGFSVPSLSLFGAQKKVEKGTAKKNNQLTSENYATIRLFIFNAALHLWNHHGFQATVAIIRMSRATSAEAAAKPEPESVCGRRQVLNFTG